MTLSRRGRVTAAVQAKRPRLDRKNIDATAVVYPDVDGESAMIGFQARNVAATDRPLSSCKDPGWTMPVGGCGKW